MREANGSAKSMDPYRPSLSKIAANCEAGSISASAIFLYDFLTNSLPRFYGATNLMKVAQDASRPASP